MSTKADRLHAAPEKIKQRTEVHPSSLQEREVLTALKDIADGMEDGADFPSPALRDVLRQLAVRLRAAIAKAESAPPCVCQVDDGLVQEWVSKARAVAKSKGFDLASSVAAAPAWQESEETSEPPHCGRCDQPILDNGDICCVDCAGGQ